MLSRVNPTETDSYIVTVEHRRLVIHVNPASSVDIADVLDGLLPGDPKRFLVTEQDEDDHCWWVYAVEYAEDVEDAGYGQAVSPTVAGG